MLLTDKGELNPSMIVRWRSYLERTKRDRHPAWTIWHALAELPAKEFTQRAPKTIEKVASQANVNPIVAQALREKPVKSLDEAARRYGEVLSRVDRKWTDAVQQAQASGKPAPAALPEAAEEELRLVFYGEGAPANVAKVFDWGFLSLLPDRPSQAEFEKLLKEVEAWAMTGPGAPPRAMVLEDAAEPYEPRVFLRGHANRPGPPVPRQFLEVLDPNRRPFQRGSGRLEMARAIVDPANPLPARVIVNRVWLHHFGKPLVETPSDFGLRSEPPSHPDLLDYLAATFVQGWSLKDLHRRIMNSAVYQQTSADRPECLAVDPENRLCWKMNRRRLEFEPLRDSLLAVSASLERRMGGSSIDLFSGFPTRRTLYGSIDRLDLPTLFTTFDFPNPATSSPRRDVTTVSPQALFLMNHPFVAEASRRVLRRAELSIQDHSTRVMAIYLALFGRRASAVELQTAERYLGSGPGDDDWASYVQGLLMTNEFAFID
jgi:hypothetical protein